MQMPRWMMLLGMLLLGCVQADLAAASVPGNFTPTPGPLPLGGIPSAAPPATPSALAPSPTATAPWPTGDASLAAGMLAAGINPLTGLPVDDPAALLRRPVVVKVSNSPALVRPQAGIGQADLVFEHYTEAGQTRFSAVFYSQMPARVGSIRSARLIDHELVAMYDALLAFAGASIGVDKRIFGWQHVADFYCVAASYPTEEQRAQCRSDIIANGPAGETPPSDFAARAYKAVLVGAPAFYRDPEIPVPHNLFADLGALAARAERDGVQAAPTLLGGFTFSDEAPQGAVGRYVQVRYATELVEWHYLEDDKHYYRSSDLQRHFDSNTEAQVRAANVLILYAGHYETDIVESQYQGGVHWSVQITLWPQGEALLLRDGVQVRGRWLRPQRTESLSLVDENGAPLALRPGITWVQVVKLPEQMDSESEWVKVE